MGLRLLVDIFLELLPGTEEGQAFDFTREAYLRAYYQPLMELLFAVGLLLFMGLTAYDTQMLKHHYAYFGGDEAMLHKSSIIGALQLYLDYINIFLYVIRLLGRSRSN